MKQPLSLVDKYCIRLKSLRYVFPCATASHCSRQKLFERLEGVGLLRTGMSALRCAAMLVYAFIVFSAGAADEIKPPRAARSVHLQYSASDGDVFYNEVTVEQSTAGSYFMACGWNTGYFGMQQLGSSTNKVVIFSVWDPTRGDDANKVPLDQRVEILHQDPGAQVSRFGGEGTGGKCMWPYVWQTNETCRFIVSATVEGEKTSYAGWFFDRHVGKWRHLVTFRTRTGGQRLRGLYSFVEDFRRDGKSVNETRRARFGNGWLLGADDKWTPLNKITFTASNAEWESKENIDVGVVGTEFYLATGGNITATHALKDRIQLPENSHGQPPELPDGLKR